MQLLYLGPLTLDVESGHIPKHLQLKLNSSQMKTGILSVPSGFGECFPSQNKFPSTKRQLETVTLLITALFSTLSTKGKMAKRKNPKPQTQIFVLIPSACSPPHLKKTVELVQVSKLGSFSRERCHHSARTLPRARNSFDHPDLQQKVIH